MSNIAYKMANLYVYTYKGGKVSRLKNSEIGVSYSAAGYYDIFVCTKNHFHVHYHAGFWNGIQQHIIYSVKNGKVVAKSGNYASHKAKKYLVDNTAAKRKKYCK